METYVKFFYSLINQNVIKERMRSSTHSYRANWLNLNASGLYLEKPPFGPQLQHRLF
jgi:hypothetical protein